LLSQCEAGRNAVETQIRFYRESVRGCLKIVSTISTGLGDRPSASSKIRSLRHRTQNTENDEDRRAEAQIRVLLTAHYCTTSTLQEFTPDVALR
jgi:hypothetical protein